MSVPWYRADADGWPTIAAALPLPWSKEAAVMDLRWMENEIRRGTASRIPGRVALRRRWGWTDWAVKVLLRDEASWRDPLANGKPPADRQPTASAPPADRQTVNGSSVVISEKPPADRQPTASRPPADRHTRVGEQVTIEPRTKNQRLPDSLRDSWKAYRESCGVSPRKLDASKGTGRKLAALVKAEGVDEVCAVLDWLATSKEGRAVFYRQSKQGADAIRRKFDDLSELRTSGSTPQPTLAIDPWTVFVNACTRGRWQWPRVEALLPEDDRKRLAKASAHVSAFARLQGATHDIERTRIGDEFRSALVALERT